MYEIDHPLEIWDLNDVSAGTGRAPSEISRIANSLALIKAALDHPEVAGIGHADRG